MNIKHYIGDYISINVASSKDKNIVEKASGGGVVTALLIQALEKGMIDKAIVVGMNKKKPYLHEVKAAETKEEIIESAGSKYVLVKFSDILKKIRENKDKKLAVTGLPCHVRAIRKLQERGNCNNVKLLVGLFCGYNMPFEATQFFLKKLKIKQEEIKELKYRGGKYPGGFLVTLKNGKTKFLPKYYYDFLNLMYVPCGCLACKDYTNELADVSCGDSLGYENSSLMIIRKGFVDDLADNLNIQQITEKELLDMHRHNIKHKKKGDSLPLILIRKSLRLFRPVLPIHLLGFIAKYRRKLKR